MSAIANWTAATGHFVVVDGDGLTHSSREGSEGYVVGGPFSSSDVRQVQDVPAGYEYGTAVLTFWRANMIADDTGNVILEALDDGDSVITSVETGAEEITAALEEWEERRLVLELPALTAKLRVRLIATRTLGSGNSGAAFDDFDLRLHKHLEPVDALDLDFSALPVQSSPSTWQKFHLAFPSLSTIPLSVCGAAIGSLGYSGPAGVVGMWPRISAPYAVGESIAWSDAIAHVASSCVGAWGGGVTSVPSIQFVRAVAGSAIDLQIAGGTPQRGSFRQSTSFSVRVVFRMDEAAGTACGIVGRRNNTGVGWGLQINSSGQVVAVLQGASGSKTATSSASVADGAVHCAWIVYDATAETVRVYVDRRGYVETSTSGGMGEFLSADSIPLRIGRDAPASATGDVQIVEAEFFDGVAYTQTLVESTWTYAKDPTEEIDTYVRTAAAWVDLEGGELACLASDQIALGYQGATTGLAVCHAVANLVGTFDLEHASWEKDGGTTKTAGVVDLTGLARGVTLTIDASNGFRHADITVTSAADVGVTFWARASSGTPTINVRIKTTAGTVKDTVGVVLSTSWARYNVHLDAWDGATAACDIEWISASGSVTLDLAHVVCVQQPGSSVLFQHPSIVPGPGATFTGGVLAVVESTLTPQFSAEGEIVVSGVAAQATPAFSAGVALAYADGDGANGRIIFHDLAGLTGKPSFGLIDGAESLDSQSKATAIDWTVPWTMRGRWCNEAGLLDDDGGVYGGIVVTGSASSSHYAQTSEWVDDPEVVIDSLLLGSTAEVGGASMSGLISGATIRTVAKQYRT